MRRQAAQLVPFSGAKVEVCVDKTGHQFMLVSTPEKTIEVPLSGENELDLFRPTDSTRPTRASKAAADKPKGELDSARTFPGKSPFKIRFYSSSDNAVQALTVLGTLQVFAQRARLEPLWIDRVVAGSVFTQLGTKFKRAVTPKEAKVLGDQIRQVGESKIKKLAASGDHIRAEIAEMVKVSPATLYRVLHTL